MLAPHDIGPYFDYAVFVPMDIQTNSNFHILCFKVLYVKNLHVDENQESVPYHHQKRYRPTLNSVSIY